MRADPFTSFALGVRTKKGHYEKSQYGIPRSMKFNSNWQISRDRRHNQSY